MTVACAQVLTRYFSGHSRCTRARMMTRVLTLGTHVTIVGHLQDELPDS